MKIILALAFALMLFGCISMPGGKEGSPGNASGSAQEDALDSGNAQPQAESGGQDIAPEAEGSGDVGEETDNAGDGEDAGSESQAQTGGKTDVLMLGRSEILGAGDPELE